MQLYTDELTLNFHHCLQQIRHTVNSHDDVTLLQRFRRPFQRRSQEQEMIAENEDEESLSNDSRQFRIEATRRPQNKRHHIRNANNNMSWFRRIVTLNGCVPTPSIGNSNLSDGVTPNHSIAMYLHWMFRVNFFFLFIVMCVAFFALVLFFSGFITLAGRLDHECVRVGTETFASEGAPFAVAFALSWTTISTVRLFMTKMCKSSTLPYQLNHSL